mgnify:CR=1 FL=1|tara:strand:- start:204 stop:653 length:450 start_codon:yes stop_codon:yes gene_type:complete
MTRRKDPNSRTGQLRAIIRQNPELTNTEIALLTDEPANLVSVARVSMRAKKKNKPVNVVYQKKTTPSIVAVSGPEEEEAFKQLEANSLQVGGSHYRDKTIQPWDYIASNNIGYLEGNIVKYVSRWQAKGGLEDLKKAQHYLTKLIEVNS